MNNNNLIRILLEIVLEEVGKYHFITLEDCMIIIEHVHTLFEQIQKV